MYEKAQTYEIYILSLSVELQPVFSLIRHYQQRYQNSRAFNLIQVTILKKTIEEDIKFK